MVSLGVCKSHYRLPFLSDVSDVQKLNKARSSSWRGSNRVALRRKRPMLRGCSGENQQEEKKRSERRTFLTMEEAGLVEVSGLSTHERFLCRLTISSLNLLRVIAEQEGCSIEELNAGRLCDWFLKDKLKREQDVDSSVLQWDDSEFQF